MGEKREVDPNAATLADVSRAAGIAAHTLTGAATTPMRSPDPSRVGQLFAHFRVEKPLGRGGMGEVYLATDLALDRPVALKLLPLELAQDAASRDRFVREARAQARLHHPNICHIYFIGEQDGQLFFAMEYIEGESLQQRLDRDHRIAPAEAIEYCRMAALGLREAHQHGFTHRDIKPSNLMLDRHGVIKLADFGIVKEQKGDSAQTGGDIVLGTPHYMAPEQARGDPVDFRADMYALGVTLHHLVTGQPPFTGETPLAVVSLHLSEPRPRLENKQARLDAVLERMMAKRPSDRYPSYDELIAALERLSPRHTRVAGLWVRVFALLGDCILASLPPIPLGLLWEVIRVPLGISLSPAWAMYTFPLYFILFWSRGRSPGMMALELQLETDTQKRPGLKRAAIRWIAAWGPVYVLLFGDDVLPDVPRVIAGSIVTAIWLAAVFLVRRHDPEGRALWDRVAGTRLVYRRS